MLTALSNLWKMIVKVLTLGTVKGNAYLDSKVSPMEKVDLLMKQAQKQATDRRHEFFKIAKSYEDSQTELEKAESELTEVEAEIQSLLDDGNEVRAKQQARLALQQSRYVDTLKANVVNFEKRKFEIQSKVDKLNTDVKILKSKRRELEMAVTVIIVRAWQMVNYRLMVWICQLMNLSMKLKATSHPLTMKKPHG